VLFLLGDKFKSSEPVSWKVREDILDHIVIFMNLKCDLLNVDVAKVMCLQVF